jgi:hypothetical protein
MDDFICNEILTNPFLSLSKTGLSLVKCICAKFPVAQLTSKALPVVEI